MRNILLTALAVGALLVGCNKNDKKENNQHSKAEVKEISINATAYDTWKYFSFTTGKEVNVTDPKNDLSWDIAFKRYYVRLNGGASGKGKGEVFKTDSKDFDAVKSAPATGYTKDINGTIPLGMKGGTEETTLNMVISGGLKKEPEISGFVTYDPAKMQRGETHPYDLTKWVYIVKNAEGKFVKIQFTDFTDAKNKGGHPKFKYQLSSNDKF